MVQKDDHVSIKFEYKYPKSSNNISIKKEYNKDLKSLSSMIKDNIISYWNLEKYVIDYCILKISDHEIDITKFISNSELSNRSFEEVHTLNTEEVSLEVLIVFNYKVNQYSENECLINPISESKCNVLHNSNTTKVGLNRSCTIPTTNQDFDNKNINTTINLDNAGSIKSVSYNNAEPMEYKYVGLVNQAMTCYLNSLLQALYMTPEFRNAVYNWEYKSSEKSSEDKSIPYQLQKLFLNLQTSSKSAIETTSLTTSFGWNYHDAWDQHDIQELCRVMFDALEQTFKNTEQADLISSLYEGKINDYVKCLTCHKEKSREDTFLDIPLPVKPYDANVAYGCVEEALEAFVKYETLEGNNQYFCEECNAMSNAHKGLKFTKFPYILTLQLKRFDFDQKSFHRIKLNDKVTFPDVLNLNSFIESESTHESPSCEDNNISIKYDDSSTSDSSVMDEEYVVNDVIMSNSNHLNNTNQDDDEGIDINVGLSSYNTYNHNIRKLRKEYASAKGPYIYELFSIMIHSGSASGGHYYAYIKDFRTKKWLCFNDQIVKSIEHTEIPKIYGGNTKGSYYSGAYRSSTNAYMLMYRQINVERNALPLKAEDFPIHIKNLLEKIKKSEKNKNYYEDHSNMDHFLQIIYYRHPTNNNLKYVNIFINMNYTLEQVAECVYKKANLDGIIELRQCRIVTYFVDYDLVNRTYDQDIKLNKIFNNQHNIDNLLLDICKSDNFEIYSSDPIITKIFLVDPIKQELVDVPKFVRAYKNQTIKDYKQRLIHHFDINPDNIKLMCQQIQPNILEDDFIFESQRLSPFYICATELNEAQSIFLKMSKNEYLNNIITFDLDVTNVNREQCELLKIPSLNEYVENNIKKNNSSHYHCPVEQISKLSMSSFDKYNCNNEPKMIDLQETSNSEDSSLSDSDKTLIGDVPEDSDPDCELSIGVSKKVDINKKCIKIKRENSRLWKVSITLGITEDELREHLQTYLKIPKEFFRILKIEEDRSCKVKTIFTEGLKYQIDLGRILHCDENKVDVYILDMEHSQPLQKLFTMAVKKNILIGNLKCQIIAELKRNNNTDLSYERYRFMEICNGELYDDTMSDDTATFLAGEVCIQRISNEIDQSQSFVYLKKWNYSEMQFEDVQKILINNDNFNEHLKKQINLIAEIPVEYIQFYPLVIQKSSSLRSMDNCDWLRDVHHEKIDLFKNYIVYRDSRQNLRFVHEKESHKIDLDKKNLIERGRMTILPTMTSSTRKEKALKIHVHST